MAWTVILLCFLLQPSSERVSTAGRTLTYSDLLRRLVDLDRLSEPPLPGITCRQFSSYDRRSQIDAATGDTLHWDANNDAGHFIRQDPEGWVMAEMDGPGCIVRIWSANPKGDLLVFTDHHPEPILRVGFQDLTEGKVGRFIPPLVGVHGRGANSYVPIPYQDHCRLVATSHKFYYHVDYVTFPENWEMPWFSLPVPIPQDETLWLVTGLMRDYPQTSRKARLLKGTQTGTLTVEPGQEKSLAGLKGPGAIESFRVKVDADDDEVLTDLLRKCVLEITWDDEAEPAVEAPLGDFFGTGPGLNRYQSIPLGVDAGWLYCNWVMPFTELARIQVRNHADRPLKLEWEIGGAPLATGRKEILYFHARWRRSAPNTVFDWPILECQGPGRYVGCALTVWNPTPAWWGEGDEKIYVDGEIFPSWFGTGTEDYFGDAWGHRVFEHPLHNCTRMDGPGFGQYTSVNRWHLTDAVPFQRSFRMTIENYAKTVEYAVVAYWYAAPGSADFFERIRPEELVVRPWQQIDETEIEDACTLGYAPVSDGLTDAGQTQVSDRWMVKTDTRRGALSKNTAWVFRAQPGARAESNLNISPLGPCWTRFRGSLNGNWSAAVNQHPTTLSSDASHVYVGPFEATDGKNRFTFTADANQTGPAELTLDTFTLDRPVRKGVVEAESLEPEHVEGGKVSITDETFGYGKWRALEFVTPQVGRFDLRVPADADGDYRVIARLSIQPPGASCVCSFGGVAGRTVVDEPDRPGLRDVYMVQAQSVDGKIRLQFNVRPSNQPEAAAGSAEATSVQPVRLVVDSFRLVPLPNARAGAIEFESMTLLAKAPDFPLRPQKAPAYFSQEAFLLGDPTSAGAAATVAFEVPESGTYEGKVYIARAPNHGEIRLILDGNTLVEAFDAYASVRGPSGPVDLGSLDLAAGQHRLTVFVLGKNPESTAHAFALDCLVLRSVE